MTLVLQNTAKIKPRQHILAFPVSDMSGSYWVRAQPEDIVNTIRENQFIAESNKENIKTDEKPKVMFSFPVPMN